ncbi:hypothetical protein SKAU_G00241140 [Synaphobranchus kaupii]|uniref:Uncharacterized protein n=1 Tax=Synaphobranchus kaupii TaxID=118154 RepID=A0A9Q1F7P4_SYNKA|nr:hypothetical protein SKAU_G00241140 [Synaphobranchus kaupii]
MLGMSRADLKDIKLISSLDKSDRSPSLSTLPPPAVPRLYQTQLNTACHCLAQLRRPPAHRCENTVSVRYHGNLQPPLLKRR